MSKHCVIMKRIKDNYESRSRNQLTRRIPVIMRIDGKAFHTYTKGLCKPFDQGLIDDMHLTAAELLKTIQGAKCVYVQSDEISILITDYDKLETDCWFGYDVQKMTSISASIATAKFNQLRMIRDFNLNYSLYENVGSFTYELARFPLAQFDSRVFNIPKEEVANYFLARQKDAIKNSIASVAQNMYSPRELNGKNQKDQLEMIKAKGEHWNEMEPFKRAGCFITRYEKGCTFQAIIDPFTYETFESWL